MVNYGGVSYASFREVPIVEEILRYHPDLIILCIGYNEFLEDRTYRQIKRIPEVLRRPLEIAAGLRTSHALNSGIQSLVRTRREQDRAGRPVLRLEVGNLDTPPFKSEHRAGLTEPERRRFDPLRHKAARQFGGDPDEAIRLLHQALAIGGQHAGLHYDLAECARQQGRTVEARAEFLEGQGTGRLPVAYPGVDGPGHP